MRARSVFAALVAVLFCFGSGPAFGVVYLQANFDTKTVGEQIGTGGAAVGEPVGVSSAIVATVRGEPMPTPFLEIRDNHDYSSGSVRFEFLGGVEVSTGFLVVTANLWFPEYENTFLYVREQGGAAQQFTTLRFTESGSVYCNDAHGNVGVIAAYDTGRHIRIVLVYNMDAGIYTIWWDGEVVLSAREHGVVGRGIGSVLFGCANDADYDGALYIDDLFVADYPGAKYYLRANFNYKEIDAPLETGGAEIGEPMRVDATITATVRDGPMPTPCVEIQDHDPYGAGTVMFEFVGGAEVLTGLVVIEAQLWFDVYEDYYMYVREHGSNMWSFLSLYFVEDGSVFIEDQGGMIGVSGTYEIGRTYPVRAIQNMDTGTYDLWLDGVQILDDEPHDVPDRGIGRVGFGCTHDPDYDGRFYIDNVWVAQVTQERPTACCSGPLCELLIPRDCAYLAGEIQEGTWSCQPNPCVQADVVESGAGHGFLLRAAPNPFAGSTTLSYRGIASGDASLSIIDAAGRRVREVRLGRAGDGAGSVVWDGRDAGGIPVAPGVYFARLAGFGRQATETLVVLE